MEALRRTLVMEAAVVSRDEACEKRGVLLCFESKSLMIFRIIL